MRVMTDHGKASTAAEFDFSGGALCLDFVNTLGDRPLCQNEQLGDFSDLLRWAAKAGVVDGPALRGMRRQAARQPGRARESVRGAIELRERLYRIFSGLAAGNRPARKELAALNAVLGEALSHLRLAAASDGVHWNWAGPVTRLDRMLWPVTRSAAELLTSPEIELLRECASDRCSWMFIDRSRTRRRRWCDMKVCGNRAKARRHYARRKQREGQG